MTRVRIPEHEFDPSTKSRARMLAFNQLFSEPSESLFMENLYRSRAAFSADEELRV